MKIKVYRWNFAVFAVLSAVVWSPSAHGATPTADQALKLTPIQRGIDYSQPEAQQVAQCKLTARKIDGKVGWIVQDPTGLILRKFVDNNGDNVVDQWSYYKDGLEVYRDIDVNYNGKADNYRWFHTGGSRWGLDNNEDGTVDAWKTISAEEVTAEVVAALANRDAARFARVLLTADELKSLGLGPEKSKSVAEKASQAGTQFAKLAAAQKTIGRDTKWLQFSGSVPGIVPAGTNGSTKDLRVYENVTAIIEANEEHAQVQIGTLVKIGDVWRVIDLPQIGDGTQDSLASGFFFRGPAADRPQPDGNGPSEAAQKAMDGLEELDQATATAENNVQRAALLEILAAEARTPQDRATWVRQLADVISAAVQTSSFPGGAEKLQQLLKQLEGGDATDKQLAAYVKFRLLTAAYTASLQAEKPDFAKIQTQWLKDLEQYVADYPGADDSAEALLQLAISREFAGQEDEAQEMYGRIVKDFPDSTTSRKAAGAKRRLGSIGKAIRVSGKGISGGTVSLSKYRGKVVVVQYWATWCEPCKSDIVVLKDLLAKHGQSLAVIGISLDASRKDLAGYLKRNRLPWPVIFEEGGLDSRPANDLGILTLPTMLLIDQQGKVVRHNIQVAELEKSLKKLVQTPVARQRSSSTASRKPSGSR